MVFDGRTHLHPTLLRPLRYHPEATATAVVLSGVLRNAYVAGRHSHRIVFATVYPYDFRDPAVTTAIPAAFRQSGYVRIGEGYRFIPAEVTHLVCEAVVGLAVPREATLDLRVVVNGGASATGAPTTRTSPQTSALRVGGHARSQTWGRFSPFGDAANTMAIRAEVAVPAGARAAIAECYAELRARTTDDLQPATVAPHAVSCWWEVRG